VKRAEQPDTSRPIRRSAPTGSAMWIHGSGDSGWTYSHARCAELSGQIRKSQPASAESSRAESSMIFPMVA
jgi:hypothetical protein